MPAARYWRIIGVETYGVMSPLELTEFALYAGASRVDTTPTSTVTPASGTLASLADANTATSVQWDGELVARPGFAIQWDLGTDQDVTELRVGGVSQASFLYAATLQYSSDGLTWTFQIDYIGVEYLAGGSLQVLSTTEYIDRLYSRVGILLRGQSASGSTTITDYGPNALTQSSNSGVINSDAQSKFGGYSIKCSGGKQVSWTGLILSTNPYEATFECWLFIETLPSADTNIFSAPGSSANNLRLTTAGLLSHVDAVSNNLGTLTTGVWHHVAVSWIEATSNTIVKRGFLNGAQSFQQGYGPPYQSPYMSNPVLGSTDATVSFYVDDLRTTSSWQYSGAARYTGAYTPPTKEHPSTAGDYTVRMLPLPKEIAVGVNQQAVGNLVVSDVTPLAMDRDLDDFGFHQITGTVKEKGTPSNLPLKRRVRLIEEVSGRLIRETWSDATTGEYGFANIKGGVKYTVISYDHTTLYRAVVADNLLPELMP